jgi:hypothetical protein
VIDPVIADTFRWVLIVGSLALVVSTAYAVRYSEHADQRVRFGIIGAFGVLLTRGSVVALGQAAADSSVWALPLFALVVALAVWSTIKYVVRARAGHRE